VATNGWFIAVIGVVALLIFLVLWKTELYKYRRRTLLFGMTAVQPYQGSELIVPEDNRTYNIVGKHLFPDGSYNLQLGDERGTSRVIEIKNPAAIAPEKGIAGIHNLVAPTHGKFVFRLLDAANADPRIVETDDITAALIMVKEAVNKAQGVSIQKNDGGRYRLHIGDFWQYEMNWNAMEETINYLRHQLILVQQLCDSYENQFTQIAEERVRSTYDIVQSAMPGGLGRGMPGRPSEKGSKED
jgi:hypothetical protein